MAIGLENTRTHSTYLQFLLAKIMIVAIPKYNDVELLLL